MSNPRVAHCCLFLVSVLSASCDVRPERAPDCVVFVCGYSWGHVGNNIWGCGEENPDEMVVEVIRYEESPFPSSSARDTYPCGTDLRDELGFPIDQVFASGDICEAVGVPVERIGDEETICDLGEGDDDDSGR